MAESSAIRTPQKSMYRPGRVLVPCRRKPACCLGSTACGSVLVVPSSNLGHLDAIRGRAQPLQEIGWLLCLLLGSTYSWWSRWGCLGDRWPWRVGLSPREWSSAAVMASVVAAAVAAAAVAAGVPIAQSNTAATACC